MHTSPYLSGTTSEYIYHETSSVFEATCMRHSLSQAVGSDTKKQQKMFEEPHLKGASGQIGAVASGRICSFCNIAILSSQET